MATNDIKDHLTETVKAMLSVIEAHDVSIRENSERIARLSASFSTYLKLPKQEIERIYVASLLHDIGMIHIPSEIIQKPDKLTEGEMAMVKMHPEIAEKILSNLSFLKGMLPVIRHHHEAFDGSGYPDGLKGDKIPVGARILCLVESYDAMVSGRPYRPALSMKEVLEDINKNTGQQFDGSLVNDFVEFLKSASASESAARHDKDKEKKGPVRETVDKVVQQFKAGEILLPALPNIVYEIQKIIKDSISTTDDIAKVIEKDVVISLRLITISNSATYRGADKIETVRKAVPRLGIKQTQSIVTAIANKDLYKTEKEEFMSVMEKLWMHSLASAYGARIIASKLVLGEVEEFFLMGLVHDIGKVLLFRPLTEIIAKTESLSLNDLMECIQEVHADFGGALLQRLNFSQDFTRVARLHEGPKFSSETQKQILAVNLANKLAHKLGYSLRDDEEIELSEIESAKLLEIEPDTLNVFCEEMKKIMDESAQLF